MSDQQNDKTVFDSESSGGAAHNLPVFDASTLEESGLPAAKLIQLLRYYMEDVQRQLQEMQTALRDGQTETVGKIAHSLKSSSRQMGALRLGDAAWQVEQAARKTPVAENLEELLSNLTSLSQPTLETLTQHVNKDGSQ